MTRLTPIALFAFLFAAPAFADELVCSGALGPDSSEARLIETYGKENVVTGDVPGPEGDTVLATTVFPNDETKKFQVGWWDEDKREQPAYFTVPADATAPGGVRIGQTVAEVQALNGEPFTLWGFYWDYGGSATFESGKLANPPGGCIIGAAFAPTKDLPAGVDDTPVVGDKQISSTEPLLAQLEAKTVDVYLSYPDPNADEDGGDMGGKGEAN